MINKASSPARVASSRPVESGTSASTCTTSAKLALSSREPAMPSLPPPRQSLHSAAESGDETAMRIAYQADRTAINEVDPQTGLTPLPTAMNGNHQQAVKTLVTPGVRGYEVHPQRLPENGSLHAVSGPGDPPLLGKILKISSRNLNAHDPISGLTPLAFALRAYHLDAARMLLEAGAKPGEANADGSLPLVQAASNANAAAVRLLLEHGARSTCSMPMSPRSS